jgi:hypothetical protein
MRRIWQILFALAIALFAANQLWAAGTDLMVRVTNDSVKVDTLFFTVILEGHNRDTILAPPYEARTTWVSPFNFSGSLNINWMDTTLSNGVDYISDLVLLKYATSQFNTFWDLMRSVYVESWDDNALPDRFCYVGIANANGYPPSNDTIQLLSWHAITLNNSGYFCIDSGNMDNDFHDWLFDDGVPFPVLPTHCWRIDGDTLKAFTVNRPVLDSLYDTLRVSEIATLIIPGQVRYDFADSTGLVGYDTLKATDAGDDAIVMSYYSPDISSSKITFTDSLNGVNGMARFVYTPGAVGTSQGTVYFIASDGLFADTEIVIIKVENANFAPSLTNISSPQIFTEDVRKTINLSATDADGDSVKFSFSPSLANASITATGKTTATFAFTPRETQSPDTIDQFIFMANDGYATDADTVKLIILEVNDPPVLNPIGAKSVAPNTTLTISISSSNPEGNNLITLTASALPTGAEFVDKGYGNGTFTWTPADSQLGVHYVTFRAYDGELVDTEKVSISVETSVKEIHSFQLPTEFSLSQNYPNPFNPSTTIEFALPTASHVNITVYNVLGQKVRTLVDEYLPAGYKSVVWNGDDGYGRQIASGIYFYMMTAKNYQSSKKLILLK